MRITRRILDRLSARATVARGTADFLTQFGRCHQSKLDSAEAAEREYREALATWRAAHPKKETPLV